MHYITPGKNDNIELQLPQVWSSEWADAQIKYADLSVENLSLMILMHCSWYFSFFVLFFIWVLWPIKIISLILSRVNHKHGAKMGDPREKPPDHPQAELGHSFTCDLSKARTQSGEMTSDLKISSLNHLAMVVL